ncbi:glucosamine-6-phosphate deaminase [Metabacillus sp. RGM 3146]|uniref:glucosamine-6-phosphate deaminase n=1 Tax=Metabacillus sp. RGM 3146 TaxID=3401092 RepID=UPI003B9C01CC
MKLIEAKNYQDMSLKAAEIIQSVLANKPDAVLGLATGGTVLGPYEILIAKYEEDSLSFKKASSVNLDEYVGLPSDHPNSYYYYMNENLFKHVDFSANQTHLPNGVADDIEKESERYENLIDGLGGIDLQLLGIGENGHIGFNEPGTPFDSATHKVKLTESTRAANARYFDSINEVPAHAITMGIGSIMKSKQILLLASGVKKAGILEKIVHEEISEEIPATILKQHGNVIIIADQDALSKLNSAHKQLLNT